MDISINVSELTPILQCAVCLDTVDNPKMLRCNHSYCKKCLDKLLKFSADGSAVIKCPNGCPKVTKIGNMLTTNDLGVDFMLKGILEKVLTKERVNTSDKAEGIKCETCDKTAARYCVYCKVLKCTTCRDVHELVHELTGDSFIPVDYNKREKKLSIICQEHSTEASFMCCDTKFVCVYCLHRAHVGHPYESSAIAEKKLQAILSEEIKFCQNLSSGLNETKKDIQIVKSNLKEVLRLKKLKCIEQYVHFLNNEEEQIKNVFELLAKEHLKPFTVLDSINYFKECLAKAGPQLLLRKSDIMGKIKRKSKMTREVVITLTESLFSDSQPLGSLHAMHGKRVSIDKRIKTFKSNIHPANIEKPSMNSVQNIKDILQNAYGGENDSEKGEKVGHEDDGQVASCSSSSPTPHITVPRTRKQVSLLNPGGNESNSSTSVIRKSLTSSPGTTFSPNVSNFALSFTTSSRGRCVVNRRRLLELETTTDEGTIKKKQRRT